MSLTFTKVKRFKPYAGIRRGLYDITFDDSYPSGGWAVTAANFRLNKLLNLILPSTGGYTLQFDQVNSKIVASEGVGDPIDSNELSTIVVRAEYVGS